ncbi:MAG: MarR family transcriptional regulator [Erysipelotrichaceae bacterium]|nr:MarR family transcriptional regulator [Erysipelotrichaceae bacterium]
MEIKDLIQRFSDTDEHKMKAIFSTLFIAGNRLQTLFDEEIPEITLKQFMLLTMVRQSDTELTLTHAGRLLGCSRQNIKKLASTLERKGYVKIGQSTSDSRAASIKATEQLHRYFQDTFAAYETQLYTLFSVYDAKELNQLFSLIMKLYEGIDQMETKNPK